MTMHMTEMASETQACINCGAPPSVWDQRPCMTIKGWQGHETVGFVFHDEQKVVTPRGEATLYSVGLAPCFTKWNDEGFPLEWVGSLVWKLVYADGVVSSPLPSGSLLLTLGDRR